jgi:hypothetical protein
MWPPTLLRPVTWITHHKSFHLEFGSRFEGRRWGGNVDAPRSPLRRQRRVGKVSDPLSQLCNEVAISQFLGMSVRYRTVSATLTGPQSFGKRSAASRSLASRIH